MKRINIRIGKETLVYIVMFSIIGIFIFNLTNIYTAIKSLKNGNNSNSNVPTENVSDDNTDDVNKDSDNELEELELSGAISYTCTLSEEQSTTNSVKETKIYIYGDGTNITGIKQDVLYEGSSDDFTNYIYSEKTKYNSLKNDNDMLEGLCVSSYINSTSSLEGLITIDYKMIDLNNIEDVNNLIVNYYKDTNSVELAKEYLVNGGFSCE